MFTLGSLLKTLMPEQSLMIVITRLGEIRKFMTTTETFPKDLGYMNFKVLGIEVVKHKDTGELRNIIKIIIQDKKGEY